MEPTPRCRSKSASGLSHERPMPATQVHNKPNHRWRWSKASNSSRLMRKVNRRSAVFDTGSCSDSIIYLIAHGLVALLSPCSNALTETVLPLSSCFGRIHLAHQVTEPNFQFIDTHMF